MIILSWILLLTNSVTYYYYYLFRYLHVSFVVVSGAGELRLPADGLAEDDALLEQEYVQLLAFVGARL